MAEPMEELTSGTVYDRNTELRKMYLVLEAQRDEASAGAEKARAEGDVTTADKLEREVRRLNDRMRNVVGAEFFRINRGLAFNVAKMFCPPGNSNVLDYQQDAAGGLWKAFLKWDPDRRGPDGQPITFGGFSRAYIAGDTQRGVRRVEFDTISHSDFSQRKRIQDAIHAFELKHGYNPSDQELKDVTGLTLSMIQRIRMGRAVSLSTPVGDGATTLADMVAGQQLATGTSFDDEATWWSQVAYVTEDLSAAELAVLIRREGVDGAWRMSMIEIAALTMIGRGTVARHEKSAEKAVRKRGHVPRPLI